MSYAKVVDCAFVNLDDPDYVTSNPRVLKGLSADNVAWAWTTFRLANWHPLTWMSLQLDGTLFGAAPRGYHLHNLLLHLCNTLLLFELWRRWTGSMWPSFFVAALFALHPLHVESVAWVSERKDVLSTFFGLLALLAYGHYVRRPGWGRYVLVMTFFALSLLAKPMLVTLPCGLLLLDYWPLRRHESKPGAPPEDHPTFLSLIWEKAPLFALSALSSVFTVIAQKHGGAFKPSVDHSLPSRAANAVIAYVEYLSKTVWPNNLTPYYGFENRDLSAGSWFPATLILLGITLLALWLWRRSPYLLIGWLWFVGTLVPVIGIVQVGAQALADRYTYVPLIGVFIAAVGGIADLSARWNCRAVAAGGGALVLFVAALLTWLQVHNWQDSVSLWSHTVRVDPRNSTALVLLGDTLVVLKELDAAIELHTKATALQPAFYITHRALAYTLHAKAQDLLHQKDKGPEEAARRAQAHELMELAGHHYRRAAALKPDDAFTHRNLAAVLFLQQKLEEAAKHCRIAAHLEPTAEHFWCLAAALTAQGKVDEARDPLEAARRLDPEYVRSREADLKNLIPR